VWKDRPGEAEVMPSPEVLIKSLEMASLCLQIQLLLQRCTELCTSKKISKCENIGMLSFIENLSCTHRTMSDVSNILLLVTGINTQENIVTNIDIQNDQPCPSR
jgi:hypothetical protein